MDAFSKLVKSEVYFASLRALAAAITSSEMLFGHGL